MAGNDSRATTTWRGDLASGSGSVEVESGALPTFQVSWGARTARGKGATSPEELIAAAHASCFSMALAHGLDQAGHAPEQLDVSATVTFAPRDGGGFSIAASRLRVRGRVTGLDADGFAAAARDAGANCPVSRALSGNVEIAVDAELAS